MRVLTVKSKFINKFLSKLWICGRGPGGLGFFGSPLFQNEDGYGWGFGSLLDLLLRKRF